MPISHKRKLRNREVTETVQTQAANKWKDGNSDSFSLEFLWSLKLYLFLKKWFKENVCSLTYNTTSAIPCKLIKTSAFVQTFPGCLIPKEIY